MVRVLLPERFDGNQTEHRRKIAFGINQVDAALQEHISDGNVHFPDAPFDNTAYVRRNNAWESKTNLAVLIGPPNPITLGTSSARLTDWFDGADVGTMFGTSDQITGGITIPVNGIFTFSAEVYGNQGNSTKEESIYLQVEIVGGPDPGIYDVSHESVDTDKTTGRSLSAFATRRAWVGETIYIRMRATAGLGTFTFERATFEIEDRI